MKGINTMRYISFFILLLFSLSLHAQSQQPWEKYLDDLGELEDIESDNWESSYDLLSDLSAHPIDLNSITREDLEQLPFLTSEQIQDICEYVYKYAPLQSVHELSMVESLDVTRRKLLECFVNVGHKPSENAIPSLKDIFKYGKQEVVGAVKVPFYDRHGDENGYLGYKYKHWLRYTFQDGQQVKFGLVASQDAGEPFFANCNRSGYDYYSFFLQLRNIGHLKALTIGRYRLKFGEGLIFNNSYGFGKLAILASLGRNSNNIYGHSSRSEANYLQGGAATVTLFKGFDLSGFISWRDIDATLNADSATIATVLKSGYHRTQSEIDRKNNASAFLAGGNIAYRWQGFHVGMTGFYTSFNRLLRPDITQRYRRYYPQGDSFWNLSVDYSYTGSRLSFSGETATGDSKALATLNVLSWQAASNLSLMALQRFYSYKFYSLYSRSFSEGGSVNDESGVYLGANWQPLRDLNVFFYTDYAYFAWPRYQVDDASHAWDNLLSITYSHKNISLLARYRLKIKEKDNADKTALINQITHRGRLSMAYQTAVWSAKTQLDMAYSHYKDNSFGWMASEHLAFQHQWLRLHGLIGYFHTRDYDSRIYVYEHGLLYNYSFPSFFGEGIRYMLDAQASIGKHVQVIAKLGTTDYFDRDHISSGYQQIDRSAQTDLEIQLRLKF
jgi:hypothetical protein